MRLSQGKRKEGLLELRKELGKLSRVGEKLWRRKLKSANVLLLWQHGLQEGNVRAARGGVSQMLRKGGRGCSRKGVDCRLVQYLACHGGSKLVHKLQKSLCMRRRSWESVASQL